MVEGEVYDVAVDLREGSPTFGKWEGVLLSAENKRQFYVPEGFAHGFLVLSDRWNDPDIGIEWPLEDIEEVLLSEKDQKQPSLKAFMSQENPFQYKELDMDVK